MDIKDWQPIKTVLDEQGKKRLGDLVQRLKGDRSQTEFAKMLGVGQSTVSEWIAGKRTPDLEKVEILAREAGMKIEDFVAYLYRGKADRSKAPVISVREMETRELLEMQEAIAKTLRERLG